MLGDVAEISISNGLCVVVDQSDFDWLNQWKWCALGGSGEGCSGPYAARFLPGFPRGVVRMHRLIIDAPNGIFVDHINRDTLDNRRRNLRLCTKGENGQNVAARSLSGFKGVSQIRSEDRWRAQIKFNRRFISLGRFSNPDEAARAYDLAALRYFGPEAALNFPIAERGATAKRSPSATLCAP